MCAADIEPDAIETFFYKTIGLLLKAEQEMHEYGMIAAGHGLMSNQIGRPLSTILF